MGKFWGVPIKFGQEGEEPLPIYKVASGSSWNEARKQLQLFYLRTCKMIDAGALKEGVKDLEEKVKFETFAKSCESGGSVHSNALARLGPSMPPGLEAPDP